MYIISHKVTKYFLMLYFDFGEICKIVKVFLEIYLHIIQTYTIFAPSKQGIETYLRQILIEPPFMTHPHYPPYPLCEMSGGFFLRRT